MAARLLWSLRRRIVKRQWNRRLAIEILVKYKTDWKEKQKGKTGKEKQSFLSLFFSYYALKKQEGEQMSCKFLYGNGKLEILLDGMKANVEAIDTSKPADFQDSGSFVFCRWCMQLPSKTLIWSFAVVLFINNLLAETTAFAFLFSELIAKRLCSRQL